MNKWRKGLYKGADAQLGDVVTAQGRADARLVEIGSDRVFPVGETIPGISREDQAAATARLSIDSIMTK
jgi:hypothetical protein